MTDSDRIHLTRHLPVDARTLWTLWTNPDHLAAWFGPHVSLDARPGGTFRERWTKDGRPTVTAGTVTVCTPPTDLAWTWADGDWTGETLLVLTIEALPMAPASACSTAAGRHCPHRPATHCAKRIPKAGRCISTVLSGIAPPCPGPEHLQPPHFGFRFRPQHQFRDRPDKRVEAVGGAAV